MVPIPELNGVYYFEVTVQSNPEGKYVLAYS
jgi:hypothetical protein